MCYRSFLQTNVLACLLLFHPALTLAKDAGDMPIHFSGVLMLESCDVDSRSATQNVSMGDFSTATFTAINSVSKATPFTISLTGCTDNITGAKVLFTGEQDTENTALLALTNDGSSSVASGVGIEILDGSGNALPLDQESSLFSLVKGDNILNFKLRYKATSVPVTAGDASSVMYFNMIYQ